MNGWKRLWRALEMVVSRVTMWWWKGRDLVTMVVEAMMLGQLLWKAIGR